MAKHKWTMIHDHAGTLDVCCVLGCDEPAVVEDVMDNPFCESCAAQNCEEDQEALEN